MIMCEKEKHSSSPPPFFFLSISLFRFIFHPTNTFFNAQENDSTVKTSSSGSSFSHLGAAVDFKGCFDLSPCLLITLYYAVQPGILLSRLPPALWRLIAFTRYVCNTQL